MKRQRMGLFFIVLVWAWSVLGWASQGSRGGGLPGPDAAVVPPSFLIAHMSGASLETIVYNPVRDRYVVFIRATSNENEKLKRFLTRLYKADGTPVGGLRPAFEYLEKDDRLHQASIAYNARDDRILFVVSLVGPDNFIDAIKAVVLDGQGRLVPNQSIIEIKGEIGPSTGLSPQAAWIAETNQYAVCWSSHNSHKPSDPANGCYLTVLNSDFSLEVKGKQVLRQVCPTHELLCARIAPADNRILWGGVEAVGTNWVKPVAWFTDLQGTVLTGFGTNGLIYPGPMVKGGAVLLPTYDPDRERFLLRWNVRDSSSARKETFRKNLVRIMDDKGVFKSGVTALPKKAPFQDSVRVAYNCEEGRFFLVAPEYRVLYHGYDARYYGMKLRCCYLNPRGRIEDKEGNDRAVSYDLTAAVLDPHKMGILEALAFNPKSGSYMIGYRVYDDFSKTSDMMGIIYK